MKTGGGFRLSTLVVVALLWSLNAMAQGVSYTQFFAGPSTPVLTGGGAGAWDEFVREKVVVIEESGAFRMWYVGHAAGGQASSKVGYATSPDGITWTRHPGNPIISRPSQDQDISVLKVAPNNYVMYVEVNNDHIDLFTSTDGIAWTEYAGNPVRTVAASPVVWHEASDWFMLYEHMAGERLEIYLATSPDGRTWTDSPSNPVLSQSAFCVPDSVVKDGDTYHLYYHEGDGGSWHATSTTLTTWTNKTRVLTAYTSQYVFRRANGQLWSYVWVDSSTPVYYLRYGRPVVYPLAWPLDEGTGQQVEDATAQGFRGTLVGGPTWATGMNGSALTFDGVDDHVRIDFRGQLSSFTVAAWTRGQAAPGSGPSSGPVHRNAAFQINWDHPDPAFRGAVALSVGGNWYSASFGPLQANTWYHLTGTYDGETLCAYTNGVLVACNTRPSGPPIVDDTALTLGRHALAESFFRGSVDDVRLYDRALAAEEVAALTHFDATPPTAPAALTAQSVGQVVNLSWTAASDPESGIGGYRIYRGTASGAGKSQLAQVAGSALAYSDASTLPNTTYYYQVAALNGVGDAGPLSNEAAASTLNLPPAAPTGLTATAGNNQVALDWADNVDADLAGYRVYRATTAGGAYSLLTPTPVTASAYTDATAANGTTYRYVVTALDQVGLESAQSSEVSATPRAVVPGLEAYWALDENTGTRANDSSGHGYTGTLVGGAAWRAGVMGSAVDFDGVDDVVITTFDANLPAWTVSAWVRSPAAPAAASASGPVQREANFQMNWNHPDAAFRGAMALQVGGGWYAASFGALEPNVWYLLTGTYDGETLRAYTNGVLVSANAAPSGAAAAEALPLVLGRHARRTTQFFAGSVDDVRVWSRALAASEIQALAAFDQTPPTAPGALTASVSGTTVTLQWTAAADPESGVGRYRVYRAVGTGAAKTLLAEVAGNTLAYADAATLPSTTYSYEVAAVNASGLEGPRSPEAVAVTAASDGLLAGLEGHWRFDEGSGTVAADTSGQGFNGTLSGGPTWSTGILGAALSYDGVNDVVTTTYVRNLARWSVSAWVRSPLAPGSAAGSGPVHREANFQINWNHPDAPFRGAAALRVSGQWHAASFGPLSPNTWYHLVATYDGETLRAYKNGVLVSSNTRPSGAPDSESRPLVFGRHTRPQGAYFSGSVDDIRLWNRVLTATEVETLFGLRQ